MDAAVHVLVVSMSIVSAVPLLRWLGAAIGAKECQKPQPEHVERGQECGKDADPPIDQAHLRRPE